MKVLILVQSVDKEPYIKLRQTQQETWDSVEHKNMKTMYYRPHPEEEFTKGKDMYIRGSEHWGFMFIQCMKAFRNVLSMEWDFLFKTDNSAYVDKKALFKLLTRKPGKKLYGGHRLDHPTTGAFLWGEGVVLSRDVVEDLVDYYIMNYGKRMGVEDAHIGAVLNGKFPWDETMTVAMHQPGLITPGAHVYRCRTTDNPEDWIKHMREIHQLIQQPQPTQ